MTELLLAFTILPLAVAMLLLRRRLDSIADEADMTVRSARYSRIQRLVHGLLTVIVALALTALILNGIRRDRFERAQLASNTRWGDVDSELLLSHVRLHEFVEDSTITTQAVIVPLERASAACAVDPDHPAEDPLLEDATTELCSAIAQLDDLTRARLSPDSEADAATITAAYDSTFARALAAARRAEAALDAVALRRPGAVLMEGGMVLLVLVLLVAAGAEAQRITNRAVARHQATLDRLQAAVGASSDAIYTKSLDGTVTSWNAAAERIFGYRAAEIVGRSIDLLFPEHLAGERKWILDYVGGGHHVSGLDTVRLRADGYLVDVSLSEAPIRAADGTITGISAVATRITARKKLEREGQRLQEAYAQTERMARVGHWFHDLRTEFVTWSDQLYRNFGYEPGEVDPTPRTLYEIVYPDDRELLQRTIADARRSGNPFRFEHRYLMPDGSVRWAQVVGEVVRDANGSVVALQGMSMDVTEQKRTEASLEQARTAAEASSRAKSEFLANMSHEVRTPLNGVIGMLDLTLDTPLSDEQREYLQTAERSAETLLVVINDILDFSKIEAGQIDLELVVFDVRNTVSTAAEGFARVAHERDNELVVDIAPGVPSHVEGDPLRLRQILVNLISNAVKFTEGGEIVVRVEVADRPDDDSVALRFAVSDTGIGIPEEQQRAVFAAFTQADASTTRQFGGTGLGLSISARLAVLMGGALELQSEEGEGSRFSFTVPFRLVRVSHDRVPRVRGLARMRVLIVDDNASNRRVLERTLESWGMLPVSVSGSDAALAAVAAEDPPGFQLILLDREMPGMDGLELARRLVGAAPMLMLSSARRAADAENARDAGIHSYLVKPVRESRLLEAITAAVGVSGIDEDDARDVPVPTQPRQQGQPHYRILVAEDNEVNRRLVTALLEKHGHTVDTAADGAEAVDRSARERFDVLLMDVQMPVLDGFTATSLIRERERKDDSERIPIIAVTARAMAGDRERCLAAGMDGYVAKPIRATALTAEIAAVMRRVVRSADTGPTSDPVADGAASLPILDERGLVAAVEHDRDLAREIASIFLDTAPAMLEGLHVALAAAEPVRLRDAAHALRGSAANVRARRLFAVADEIEHLALTGDTSGAERLLERADAAWRELEPVLREFSGTTDLSSQG